MVPTKQYGNLTGDFTGGDSPTRMNFLAVAPPRSGNDQGLAPYVPDALICSDSQFAMDQVRCSNG